MQNNIAKKSFKVMNQDIAKNKVPEDIYFKGTNIRVTTNENFGSVTNVNRNELKLTIPSIPIKSSINTISGDVLMTKDIPLITDWDSNLTTFNTIESQLGHIEINDVLYVFVIYSRSNVLDEPYYPFAIFKIEEDNSNVLQATLKFFDAIDIQNKKLDIKGYFENENIVKLYWADGESQLRFINIEDNNSLNLESNRLNIVPNVILSQPNNIGYSSGGNHTSGMIQYAFNYYNQNGSQTKISPLSFPYYLNNGSNGDPINESVSKSPIIQINNIDQNFDGIRIYSVKYTSKDATPTISLIKQTSTSTNSINFTDFNTSLISVLDINEFLFLGGDAYIPEHLIIKDNRLFLGNYKVKRKSVNFDSRAYSYDINGDTTINHISGNNIINRSFNVNSIDTVEEKHDCINPDKDLYKFTGNGTELGAKGNNIKIELEQLSSEIQNISELEDVENLSNSQIVYDKTSLKTGETYRFYLEFLFNDGSWSFPKWICDYKIPVVGDDEGNIEIELTNGGLYLYYHIKTTLLNAPLESNIVGFRTAIVERTENDKTIVTQGLLNATITDNSDSTTTNILPSYIQRQFNSIASYQYDGVNTTGDFTVKRINGVDYNREINISHNDKSKLGIDGLGNHGIVGLSENRFAIVNNNYLRTFDFDGINWIQVGRSFDLTPSSIRSIAVLSSTRIALVNEDSNDQLITYDFDGINWIQVGNSLNVGNSDEVSITALTSSRIVYYSNNNHELRTYDFDGTNWSLLGFTDLFNNDRHITNLSNTRVVTVYDDGNSNKILNVYDLNTIDGTWSSFGIPYSINGTNAINQIVALNNSQIAIYLGNDLLVNHSDIETYTFDNVLGTWSDANINGEFNNGSRITKLPSSQTIDDIVITSTTNDTIQRFTTNGNSWDTLGNSYDVVAEDWRTEGEIVASPGTYEINKNIFTVISPELIYNNNIQTEGLSIRTIGALNLTNRKTFRNVFNESDEIVDVILDPNTTEDIKINANDNFYPFKEVFLDQIGANYNFADNGYNESSDDIDRISYINKLIADNQTDRNDRGLSYKNQKINISSVFNYLDSDNNFERITTNVENSVKILRPTDNFLTFQHNNEDYVTAGNCDIVIDYADALRNTFNYKSGTKLIISNASNILNYNNHDGGLMVELYKNNIEQYGGNTYEARSFNTTIPYSDLRPISVNEETTKHFGDTFIQKFTYLNTFSQDEKTTEFSETVSFPVETSINLHFRFDILNKGVKKFNSEESTSYGFNKVYEQQNNTVKNFTKPLNFNELESFKTRIIPSKLKIPNEDVDSFTDFLVNDAIDLDGSYGPLKTLSEYKDNVYSFQENAIAYLSINPRIQIPSGDGAAIELGTGSIIERYQYISTNSGTVNKFSVVKTKNGLMFFDLLNSSINFLGGEMGSTELTTVNGMHTYLKNINKKYFNNFKIDDFENGVYSVYDPLYEETLFTFVSNAYDVSNGFSEVLVYSGINQGFTSFYTNPGKMYFKYKNNIYQNTLYLFDNLENKLPSNSSELFRRETGVKEDVNVNIEFVISDLPFNNKIWNNIHFNSEVLGIQPININDPENIDLPNVTFNQIDVLNEYQNGTTNIIDLNSYRSKAKRRLRKWNFILPRESNSRNRINSSWVKIKLNFNKPSSDYTYYDILLHDILISYTTTK